MHFRPLDGTELLSRLHVSPELRGLETTKVFLDGLSYHGSFTVQDGVFLLPNQSEFQSLGKAGDENGRSEGDKPSDVGDEEDEDLPEGSDESASDADVPRRDQVVADDMIVQSSICAGFDCVNGENFGADTLRLKENNLRIHFNDTSNSGSFPTRDWRLVANDQTNGGANYLAIEDTDAGTMPFRVLAGAGNNALYVDAQGDVGLGTSTPVLELQISDGDTPSVRLEQTGSSGWTPQTWDLAGNETNFFIRDVTNSSALPFRIRPGAGANALYIDNGGEIGLGTATPSTQLDVVGANAGVRINNNNAVTERRTLLEFKNNGGSYVAFTDTSKDPDYTVRWINDQRRFTFDFPEVSVEEFRFYSNGQLIVQTGPNYNLFWLESDGDLLIRGTLYESQWASKAPRLSTVNGSETLNSLKKLNLFKGKFMPEMPEGAYPDKIAPLAGDFNSLFGVGQSGETLSPADMSGVALSAIQGLNQVVEAQAVEIETLKRQLAEMAAVLNELKKDRRTDQ
jgi:hypothetical protein